MPVGSLRWLALPFLLGAACTRTHPGFDTASSATGGASPGDADARAPGPGAPEAGVPTPGPDPLPTPAPVPSEGPDASAPPSPTPVPGPAAELREDCRAACRNLRYCASDMADRECVADCLELGGVAGTERCRLLVHVFLRCVAELDCGWLASDERFEASPCAETMGTIERFCVDE